MLLCGFCSTGARERMMRKTRDYDAELRALSDKAKSIKAKKIQQLGELVTGRSEEHTSELQSLLRISYAVFCLKKKNDHNTIITHQHPDRSHNRKKQNSTYQ